MLQLHPPPSSSHTLLCVKTSQNSELHCTLDTYWCCYSCIFNSEADAPAQLPPVTLSCSLPALWSSAEPNPTVLTLLARADDTRRWTGWCHGPVKQFVRGSQKHDVAAVPGLGLGENVRVHLSGSLRPPNEAARCFPCNAHVTATSVPFEFELRLVSPGARISQSSTLEMSAARTRNVLCSIIKLLSGSAFIAVYLAS